MNFRLDEQQRLVQQAARDLLGREAPMRRVREIAAAGGWDADLWQTVTRHGWMGLAIPEERGGAGMTLVELGVIAEETGAVLLPLPVLSTALAGLAVCWAGTEAATNELVPALVQGDVRGALVPSERLEGRADEYTVTSDDAGITVNGVRRLVPHGDVADVLVDEAVFRTGSASTCVPFVVRTGPSVSSVRVPSIDITRSLADVQWHGARIRRDEVLDLRGFERVQDAAVALVCAELVGVGRRALDLAVSYASSRRQFGRVIGSFQAVKHLCAEMKVLLENAWSVAYYALWSCAAGRPDARRAVSMAKAYCGPAMVRLCEMAIQVHGGIGYTWECDVHLYLKRALCSAARFGHADLHRERVLTELGL